MALLSTIALLLIGLAIFSVISSGEGKIKIYFYSSETNINNFRSLKMEFDRYLSRFAPMNSNLSVPGMFSKNRLKAKKTAFYSFPAGITATSTRNIPSRRP